MMMDGINGENWIGRMEEKMYGIIVPLPCGVGVP